MKIRLVWVGANSDPEMRALIARYSSRIKHFFPLEVAEVAAEKDRQKKSDVAIMRAESARVVKAIPPKGLAVAVDPRGKSMDSLKFARWLERLTTESPWGVTFILGGDVGLDESIRTRADQLLSLSEMTLPHQLARLVLLEQIYRACTIMRNVPYHK
jgi:23S rRNA (pseudouridine1915-N3)-methyltransferase